MRNTVVLILVMLLSVVRAGAQGRVPVQCGEVSIGRCYEMKSKALGEVRKVNVYLPEGYDANDSVRYPVVYLLDGGADEDFIHVVGAYQFSSFSWVHRVKPSIIIGIVNVDRRRDYTFPTKVAEHTAAYPTTGHSAPFINYLEQELMPWVKRNYRVNGSRTIIGESLGGLLATEILINDPAMFNRDVIISPSLWWNEASLLKTNWKQWSRKVTKPTEIYIGVGKEGLTPGPNPRVMEVDANVLYDQINAQKNSRVKVKFDYLQDEDHATIGHQAVLNSIKYLK